MVLIEPVLLELTVFAIDDRERTCWGVSRGDCRHRNHRFVYVRSDGFCSVKCLASARTDDEVNPLLFRQTGDSVNFRLGRLAVELHRHRTQSCVFETRQYTVFKNIEDDFVGDKHRLLAQFLSVRSYLLGNIPALYVRCR